MKQLEKMLAGNDLRSIGQVTLVIQTIKDQSDFDELFLYLYNPDRGIVMRAADAIEKITISKHEYLVKHKDQILDLCRIAKDKELKWHLALLLPRVSLTAAELVQAQQTLTDWAKDKSNSRIVRVNALQGLFELSVQKAGSFAELNETLSEVEQEDVPSISARVRIIRKQLRKQKT